MNDVMKKRVVGAVVLVILGVLLPLLLARCLHGDGGADSASMRVYEVTPDGQARPADGSEAAKVAGQQTDKRRGQQSESAAGPVDGSTGAPRPQAVSPSADTTNDADDDASFDTPPVQGGRSDSRQTASATPAPDRAEPEPAASSANAASSTAPAQANTSLRKTGSDGSGWVIQVASFGDEANAKRLATQLNADYRAFYRAGNVNGKTWYRVRIGPFDSESQAQTVAARLRQQGRSTLVQRAE
ncbi:SPOR domain-containing protein [Salinisphaera sp. T31B1]|uniref:SPOR domain-containing protein n=1 Tax=Salinisphaera sp. T31B1 TaxID=727963 RepID=UPI00334045FD